MYRQYHFLALLFYVLIHYSLLRSTVKATGEGSQNITVTSNSTDAVEELTEDVKCANTSNTSLTITTTQTTLETQSKIQDPNSTSSPISPTTLKSASLNMTTIVTTPPKPSDLTQCVIKHFFFFKTRILVEHGRFNANKCLIEYCTPSLEIEPFTCKNLQAMIVPPASSEDEINAWKVECAKNNCVP